MKSHENYLMFENGINFPKHPIVFMFIPLRLIYLCINIIKITEPISGYIYNVCFPVNNQTIKKKKKDNVEKFR